MLQSALALAQRDGIESLTMRKLAEELGAGAMSLYHYVPNKEELLDGMVDIVFAEIELPTTDVDWRTATAAARALDPRGAQPPPLGGRADGVTHDTRALPASRLHDAVLGCLREAGFSIEMTIQAYSVQDAYIYGFALQEKSVPFETAEESAAVAEEQVPAVRRARGRATARRARGGVPLPRRSRRRSRRQGRLRLRRRVRVRPRPHPRRARATPQ